MTSPARASAATPVPLSFGTHRIGAGWIGIGIAAGAFTAVAAALLSVGAPAALLAVGPLLLAFGLCCATTRVVVLDPGLHEARVTRRLLGISATRRVALARFDRVEVAGSLYFPKHARPDGTLAGNQPFMHYLVRLEGAGRRRLLLEHLRVPDAAESLATGLGRLLGLPAERLGYTRQPGRKGPGLSVIVKGRREPIAP